MESRLVNPPPSLRVQGVCASWYVGVRCVGQVRQVLVWVVSMVYLSGIFGSRGGIVVLHVSLGYKGGGTRVPMYMS
jgi:hypothetical protein